MYRVLALFVLVLSTTFVWAAPIQLKKTKAGSYVPIVTRSGSMTITYDPNQQQLTVETKWATDPTEKGKGTYQETVSFVVSSGAVIPPHVINGSIPAQPTSPIGNKHVISMSVADWARVTKIWDDMIATGGEPLDQQWEMLAKPKPSEGRGGQHSPFAPLGGGSISIGIAKQGNAVSTITITYEGNPLEKQKGSYVQVIEFGMHSGRKLRSIRKSGSLPAPIPTELTVVQPLSLSAKQLSDVRSVTIYFRARTRDGASTFERKFTAQIRFETVQGMYHRP